MRGAGRIDQPAATNGCDTRHAKGAPLCQSERLKESLGRTLPDRHSNWLRQYRQRYIGVGSLTASEVGHRREMRTPAGFTATSITAPLAERCLPRCSTGTCWPSSRRMSPLMGFKPGDHAQECEPAADRGTDENDQFVVFDAMDELSRAKACSTLRSAIAVIRKFSRARW